MDSRLVPACDHGAARTLMAGHGRPHAANRPDQHERDLEGAIDFLEVLLAMAGHDLRQPLQVILSAFHWLGGRLGTDSEREYVRRGETATRQLTGQLNRLVDALRLHQRASSMVPKPIHLGSLLVELCRDNGETARQKGIDLCVVRTRAVVLSDGVILEAILRNLIRNALGYTRPGGRILVGCRRRGPHVRIEVRDTGVGIPRDRLSRVFEAFHRVDSIRPDGLGLGLFVVKRAADLLGHRIEVWSEEGRGSCFAVLAIAAGNAAASPDLRSAG